MYYGERHRSYSDGKVKKWSDIYPSSKRGDIVLVFDNKKSSTVHFAEDSILHGNPITSPNVIATNKTADVINYVEKNAGAIGIIGSNWLNDKTRHNQSYIQQEYPSDVGK